MRQEDLADLTLKGILDSHGPPVEPDPRTPRDCLIALYAARTRFAAAEQELTSAGEALRRAQEAYDRKRGTR